MAHEDAHVVVDRGFLSPLVDRASKLHQRVVVAPVGQARGTLNQEGPDQPGQNPLHAAEVIPEADSEVKLGAMGEELPISGLPDLFADPDRRQAVRDAHQPAVIVMGEIACYAGDRFSPGQVPEPVGELICERALLAGRAVPGIAAVNDLVVLCSSGQVQAFVLRLAVRALVVDMEVNGKKSHDSNLNSMHHP